MFLSDNAPVNGKATMSQCGCLTGIYNPTNKRFPSLPNDLYYQGNHNGQIVAVIPSRDIVFVRLGDTLDDSWNHDSVIKQVLECTED